MSGSYLMHHRNRICFLGNNTKTDFFHQIAGQLNSSHTRISWIVVNAEQCNELRTSYNTEDVLYLPLSTTEHQAPFDIKINDLVFADRRLKNIKLQGIRYLRAIQAPIFDFLDGGMPTLVVGELTYGHEVLIHRMTQQLLVNCHWVSPFLTRIPHGQFAFFSDEAFSRESIVSPINNLQENAQQEDIGYKEMNRRHIDRQSSAKFFAGKIRSFLLLSGYDAEDPSWNSDSRTTRLRRNLTNIANRLSYRNVPKVGVDAIDACKGRAVIFPLHMEPELNIDTCGRYWENQTETILKIWRQLGPNDQLFIKEHPVAIGNRGSSWYRRLLAHPNLFLLHHAVPVDEILQNVDYVFTVSGTMGLEAAMMGRKVLCLAPTTYDRLENVVSPGIDDFHRARNIDDLYETLHAEKTRAWNTEEYLLHLEQHAFPGDPEGDRIANPASWNPHNVRQVAQAFDYVLNQIVRPPEKNELRPEHEGRHG